MHVIVMEVIVKARGMNIIPMTNAFQIFSLVEVYALRGNEGSCALSGAAGVMSVFAREVQR